MRKTPKKTPKVRLDVAQNAFLIVREAAGAIPKTSPPVPKNESTVELGREGGLARKKAMKEETIREC